MKDYVLAQINYSKKLKDCYSGQVVTKKGENFFIIDFPEMNERETRIFENTLDDLRYSKTRIKKKADIYFFLKNYCIENNILLRKDQREKVLLLLEWETLGDSILTSLLEEPDFEEIIINGRDKPIMLYHNIFGWLKSNIYITSDQKIKTIINKMVSSFGKQLSFHTPIINATLKNGSRLNASMDPIAFSGINATIRKFKENPFHPVDIINTKTISKEAMAFLWLAMKSSCSILVCGNTGSGKTTTLNSLFCFLPKNERIVVVEETPEIVLPQEHKIKLNTSEQIGIDLNILIENTFRMRPDRVIVGEIRSEKEARAFVNTMLAGQARGSYATFHAESSFEALQRMQSFGIEKNSLTTIDLIVVQKRINKINKNGQREERKIVEICEIGRDNSLEKLFDYNYEEEKLVRKEKSKRVFEKIKRTYSCNEKGVQKLLKEKEGVLENLKGELSFSEFYGIAEGE